jgi:hypothetical protein
VIVGDHWQRHYLTYEGLLCAVAAVAVVLWSEHCGGAHDLDAYLHDHRNELYAVSGGIYGALLGFIITATAVILDKIEQLRLVRHSRHYPTLWSTLLASMRALGLASVAAIAGLLDTHPGLGERIIFFVWCFFSLLAVARVARCIWIFGWIVRIVSGEPATNRPPGS